jgi:hypothetical protein
VQQWLQSMTASAIGIKGCRLEDAGQATLFFTVMV